MLSTLTNRPRLSLIATAAFCFSLPCLAETPGEVKGGTGLIAPAEIAAGPFKPADESFKQYRYPDWFRDAKFGIWSHWGPQAVPRQGDWYARKLYFGPGHFNKHTGKMVETPSPEYNYHVKTYGHPSEFGYKDIIPLWKAERWNPEQLMALYKKVGAKYFVSMGTHHDNFFLWDSKIHRWNSVNMGPKKDVVGLWQKAAKDQGLRFGVSEHLAAAYTWYQTSHGSDGIGPKAGVPYDGNDPQYQDLYMTKAEPGDTGWLTKNPTFHLTWFRQIKELVDLYQPDLLYSDSALPFGDVGRSMLAHYYNQDLAQNGGKLEAVYNCKEKSNGRFVRDVERGVMGTIQPDPWQTDTSIGDWFYKTGQKYMSSGEVVRMLIDIVSKNGNLLLNVVQTPEGDLEPDVLHILDGIAGWMELNREGIYSTRPWAVYGEGPFMTAPKEKGFMEQKDVPTRPFEAADFRFTCSKDGKVLYAFQMAPPTGEVRIVSLAKGGTHTDKPVTAVELLGSAEKLTWKQEADGLVIQQPSHVPHPAALTYKIHF
jgi:alpha-L-fucosidase